jgi:hypothetical protein
MQTMKNAAFVSRNRSAVSLLALLCAACTVAPAGDPVKQPGRCTEIVYLSGRDTEQTVDWEFFCTGGRRSGEWTTIAVPSNWELQGFGAYNYGHDRPKADEQGRYRHRFDVPARWRGSRVRIVFDGVMTDAEVTVNGMRAGPVHQGGFYRFRYDITDLLRFGETNLLEVLVSKVSANRSVETAERKADYWVFGGIYRPVYLEVLPAQAIAATAIDARAGGSFRAIVRLEGIAGADRLTAFVLAEERRAGGVQMSAPVTAAATQCTVSGTIVQPLLWSAETPHLYRAFFTLWEGERPVHTVIERFGFRTFEVQKGAGLFLNGQPIRLKGVNRHCFWPETGRALSRRQSLADAKLVKDMNMNAVRCSHYPPDKHFLEICDELGVYVIDELCTWQKPSLDTAVARTLVKELVERDVNHPCVLFWSNGNEGGWNTEVDGDYRLHDPQKRTVLHPWGLFNDVDTDHYESYDSTARKMQGEHIFMPTEFLHGLYDGGHGAGLEDYWRVMTSSWRGAGGFLWAFADEGIVRTDQDGRIDVDGTHAPDGIVGPHREREGSFETIRDIFSPVRVLTTTLPATFDGRIEVANDYSFTNLHRCRFAWEVVRFPAPGAPKEKLCEGLCTGPDIAPHTSGAVRLNLPAAWRNGDALVLTAIDPVEHNLWTWSWPLRSHAEHRARVMPKSVPHQKPSVRTEEQQFVVTSVDGVARFDRATGRLVSLSRGGTTAPLRGGPRLAVKGDAAGDQTREGSVACRETAEGIVIEGTNTGGFDLLRWTVSADGVLKLAYAYRLDGSCAFHGITFDFPEKDMKRARWLGLGPHRVWKNRLRGTRLDVFERDYNHNPPGESWNYPAFKGYFANVRWADIVSPAGALRLATDTPLLFLRLGTPATNRERQARHTFPPFPEGDLSLMHAIPPIGTKFRPAGQTGPQGKPNQASGTYAGVVYFSFDPKPSEAE